MTEPKATYTKNPEIQRVHDRENRAMHRATGCEGKTCYTSYSQAKNVAKRARGKSRGAGLILAPYRCKFCGSCYHLTTVDPVLAREQRRNKRRAPQESEGYDDEY